MTGLIRSIARRYALSMPIVEIGFFWVLIVALAMAG